MKDLHQCHRGPRYAHRVSNPATPSIKRGAPINASEGLCEACTYLLDQAIRTLPQDYLDLEIAITGIQDGLREPVAGTRDPAAPISLTIAATQAELLHDAQCWAESVANVLRVGWDTQAARDSRPGPVLDRAARLLGSALPVLLSLRGASTSAGSTTGGRSSTAADSTARRA